MAMINCPECGKEVSSEAASCPSCGHPIAQKVDQPATREPKKGGILKIVIAVVIALVAAPTLLFGGCVATAFLFQDYGKVGGTELTIIDKEGNVSVVPSNEFSNAWTENVVKYEKLYSGAKIEFDCKVESINSATNYNGHEMDGYIESDDHRLLVEFSDADKDFMAKLDAGDTIHVEGNIFTVANMKIEVWNINGHSNKFSSAA